MENAVFDWCSAINLIPSGEGIGKEGHDEATLAAKRTNEEKLRPYAI